MSWNYYYFAICADNAYNRWLEHLTSRFAYQWHIFIAQILDAVDFPITLPVGDLSTIVLGKTQRRESVT
jgi:hypothetical protein